MCWVFCWRVETSAITALWPWGTIQIAVGCVDVCVHVCEYVLGGGGGGNRNVLFWNLIKNKVLLFLVMVVLSYFTLLWLYAEENPVQVFFNSRMSTFNHPEWQKWNFYIDINIQIQFWGPNVFFSASFRSFCPLTGVHLREMGAEVLPLETGRLRAPDLWTMTVSWSPVASIILKQNNEQDSSEVAVWPHYAMWDKGTEVTRQINGCFNFSES